MYSIKILILKEILFTKIKAMLETIATYIESLSKPKIGIIECSQATQQMAVLFKTADPALANMDLAVEIIRSAESNYYNGYMASRKVAGTGGGFLAIGTGSRCGQRRTVKRGDRYHYSAKRNDPNESGRQWKRPWNGFGTAH